ncbi:MAG: AAA family ATPase [Cyanobacteria bacterium REEB459]|nr:AAA family ATPase [Cyanobacteria bacterium REEB459]
MKTIQDSQVTSVGQPTEAVFVPVSEAPAQPVNQGAINLRPLLRTMRRNALLIGTTTALAGGLAYAITKSVPPVYEANFKLLVEAATPEASQADPAAVARGQVRPRATAGDYATQIVILQGSKLLSDIADRVKVVYPGFEAANLQRALNISQCCAGGGITGLGATQTSILEVKYEDPLPERAELVLEEAANRFLRYSLEERKSRISEGVKFIDEQVPPLESRVASLQSQVQALQEQYLITDPDTQADRFSTQLSELSGKRLEAEAALREKVTLYQNLQKQLGMGPSQGLASSTLSQDAGYQALLRQREDVESKIAVQSSLYNEGSPIIQALRDQEQKLSDLQAKRAQDVLGPAFKSIDNAQMRSFQNSISTDLIGQMVNTLNEIQVLQSRSNTLGQAANSIDQKLRQFPAISRQYSDLKRELDLATQTLDQLLTQRETLKVEAAQSQFPWELVSTPSVPKDRNGKPIPGKSKLPRNLILGLMAGFVAGTAAASLREKSKDIFFSLEDLREAIPFPLLATVPYDQEVNRGNLTISGLGSSPNSYPFVSSFNNLYTGLRLSPTGDNIKSVAVGSPCPDDGKSTVALNLANAAAMANQRVLLVDANFQDPQIHHLTSLSNTRGLSDVLAGNTTLEEAISAVKGSSNLYVLTAGQSLAGSAKLLASAHMRELAEQLKGSFDLVIYDSPSFEESSDIGFIASYASSMVLVVGLRRTSKAATTEMLESLESFKLPCVGFVTNYA